MKTPGLILFLLLASAAWGDLRPLVPGENDAEWQPLLRAMAANGAVQAPFTERRWFPFRKEPVVLQGELRYVPARGLSLRYTVPEDRLMIVDAHGIRLRDEHGRTRDLKPDPRAGQIDRALLPVLRFDLAALATQFSLAAERLGDGSWRLELTPKDEALARTLGRLTVSGAGAEVRRLEFRRAANQRVEIALGQTRTGVIFSAAELNRFFREP